MSKYKTFEDWYEEQENYGFRMWRFWDDVNDALSIIDGRINIDEYTIKKWLQAAFEAGKES